MYFFLILIPVISLFGVITNGLNICVFLNPKMKDPTFKYMLAISVSNLFYTGLLSYGYLSYCDECNLSHAYSTQLFKILVDYFICSALALFNIFIEILISFHRYFMLKNNENVMEITKYKLMMPALLLISIIIYVPVLFTYEIVLVSIDSNMNATSPPFLNKYTKYPTEFGIFLILLKLF